MKILVTGARGQLGREAVLHFEAAGMEVSGIDRDELDLSQPDGVAAGIASFGADWVIHCAAYTRVDMAEQESELAYLINRDSARAVAEGVRQSGGRMLYVSTDFIFGGDQSRPYREDDAVNPLGVYGHSKWKGEQAVRDVLPGVLVLRTAWVYGVHGQNFVRTMLRLAAEREVLRIVDDQVGTPTWTRDVVLAVDALMQSGENGIFNYTNEGVASWYDFARDTIEMARGLGYPIKAGAILPISSSEYPTPARRPSYSVLSKEKVRPRLGWKNPHWRESLFKMLEQLKEING